MHTISTSILLVQWQTALQPYVTYFYYQGKQLYIRWLVINIVQGWDAKFLFVWNECCCCCFMLWVQVCGHSKGLCQGRTGDRGLNYPYSTTPGGSGCLFFFWSGSVQIALLIRILTKLYVRKRVLIFTKEAKNIRGNGLSFKEPCLSGAESDNLCLKKTFVC